MGVSHQLVLFDFPGDYYAVKGGQPVQPTQEYGKHQLRQHSPTYDSFVISSNTQQYWLGTINAWI